MKNALTTHIAALAIAGAIACSLSARAGEWLTNFEAAKAQAQKDKKPILIDFTGSDWCGWCIKMKKETLDEKAFKDFAEKNLVLLEADFPERKPQADTIKKANEALKKKYGVEGFPTFLLLDSTGKEIGRQDGYLRGGPTAFIEKIEGWKKKAAH